MLYKFWNAEYGKVFKGAVIAALGAGVTYLSQWASGADFGIYTPIVAAAMSVLVNLVRKIATAE